MTSKLTPAGDEVLALVAEEAHVSKRTVVTDRVDVRTVTETVDAPVSASVESQPVEVTRVPVGREVQAAPAVRTEGDTTVIPVLEEIIVVEKRLVLKEEIRIRRVSRSDEVETTVPLRRQRAVVERRDAGSKSSDTPGPTSRETKA